MSKERKIDQGTVIYGIRSRKYPDCACYGIIITARCDIAQRKVPKYYYLVAADADSWLKSAHGYELVYGSTIKGKRNNVIQKAREVGLDGDTLADMPDDSVEIIVEDCLEQNEGEKNKTKKIQDLHKAVKEYHFFSREGMGIYDRIAAIKSKPKDVVTCMKEIDAGKLHHYFFLPQHAYLQNDVMDKGLVVDLLEIDTISIDDAERITGPHEKSIIWDNIPKLPEKEELERLTRANEQIINKTMARVAEHFRLINTYWLTNKDCFVDIEGTTGSPWCESLMQRFSYAFSRIGINNPSEGDYQNMVVRIKEEE